MINSENTMLLEFGARQRAIQGGEFMGTVTRPELSEKNKWWISKHRYYELRHFCLQYREWMEQIRSVDSLPNTSTYVVEKITVGQVSDPTVDAVQLRGRLEAKVRLVEQAAYETCQHQFWYTFLVKAVTEGLSYDILSAQFGIMPVSRNEWYELYQKFFWVLDKMHD